MAAKPTVTARAKQKSAPKHGKPKSMTIDRAENGFTTRTHFEQPQSKKNSLGPSPYIDPTEMVHETPESMHQHVQSTFPGAAKPAADADNDGD